MTYRKGTERGQGSRGRKKEGNVRVAQKLEDDLRPCFGSPEGKGKQKEEQDCQFCWG